VKEDRGRESRGRDAPRENRGRESRSREPRIREEKPVEPRAKESKPRVDKPIKENKTRDDKPATKPRNGKPRAEGTKVDPPPPEGKPPSKDSKSVKTSKTTKVAKDTKVRKVAKEKKRRTEKDGRKEKPAKVVPNSPPTVSPSPGKKSSDQPAVAKPRKDERDDGSDGSEDEEWKQQVMRAQARVEELADPPADDLEAWQEKRRQQRAELARKLEREKSREQLRRPQGSPVSDLDVEMLDGPPNTPLGLLAPAASSSATPVHIMSVVASPDPGVADCDASGSPLEDRRTMQLDPSLLEMISENENRDDDSDDDEKPANGQPQQTVGGIDVTAMQRDLEQQKNVAKNRLRNFIIDTKHQLEKNSDTDTGVNESQLPVVDLRHDWDDREGYYQPRVNEVILQRYVVFADASGKGVFSNVVKCRDSKRECDVAIKIVRNNGMMREAAEKEIEILTLLNNRDPENRKRVVRLWNKFDYRNHLCMVFECLDENLRTIVKKHSQGKGLTVNAMVAYSKQLFAALAHLKSCEIIHADVKPDNLLISQNLSLLKLCDLGSACYIQENDPSEYLVSRYYRCPEICLGIRFEYGVDVWSAACSLYEAFTGRILFAGRSNNGMLYEMQKVKGRVPKRMIKAGTAGRKYWDANLDFLLDQGPGRPGKKITFNNPTKDLTEMVMRRAPPERAAAGNADLENKRKKTLQFANLLHKVLTLDPEKRMSAEEALSHPFPATQELRAKGT